ncbi:MAG TPA: hypothetical protein VFB34_09655, partial [Chloroflexota bacterium]|nr:hypothetical protein [Chloroflexota bacterium]
MIPLEKAFSRAEEELASDRPEPALAIAGDILRAYPQCLEARRFKAAALAGLSRYEQAAEEYQQIVRLDPLDARTYVELERLSALLGRGDESRRYRVLASDHASAAGGTPPPLGGPITRARLGILTERSRLYMQSIQTLSRLIREVPDRHDLYLVFTRALWLARLKPQLLTMIGITLEVFPGSPLINVIAAWSALECGRDEAYGVHIERARAVDPTGREIERMAMGMLPRDAFHRPRPGIECPSIEGQRIPLGDTVAAMSNGKLEDQSAARDAPLRQFQEERVSVTSGRPIASVERRVSPGPQESAGPEAGGPQEESFTGDAAGRPMSETSPSSAENLSAPAGTSQTSDAAGTANGPSNEPRSDSGPPRDESVTAEPRRSRGIEDFDAWFEEHVLRPIAESPSAAEPHPEPDAMTPRSPAPPNPPGQPGPGVPSGASTSDLPDTHAPVSIGQVAPSGRLGGNAPDASSGPATSSRLEPGSGPPAEGPGFAEEPLPTKSGAGAASKEQQRLAAPANERSLGPNAGEQEPE